MSDEQTNTTEAAPENEPAVEIKKPEPRSSIDWATAILSAPFLAALAKAQAAVQTVGKDGRNTEMGQSNGRKGYDYAYSDDMIEEIRRAFAPFGISFLHSWHCVDAPNINIGDKQWLTATVILSWGLLYGDEKGNVGKLSGTAECDAIGSAGRPPDKAMMAAKTYASGYLAMGLGALNRGAVEEHEDVDRREGDHVAAKPTRPSPRLSQRDTSNDKRESDLDRAKAERNSAWARYKAEHILWTDRAPNMAEFTRDFCTTHGMNAMPAEPSADLILEMAKCMDKAAEGLKEACERKDDDPSSGPPPDEAAPKNGRKGARP